MRDQRLAVTAELAQRFPMQTWMRSLNREAAQQQDRLRAAAELLGEIRNHRLQSCSTRSSQQAG